MGDVTKIYFRTQSLGKHEDLHSKQQPTADKSAEAKHADQVPLGARKKRLPNDSRLCHIVTDYRTNERTRTVAAGLSSAKDER